jgi:hypothetical protein
VNRTLRRAWLVALVAVATAILGCSRRERIKDRQAPSPSMMSPPSAVPGASDPEAGIRGATRLLEWTFDPSAGFPARAVVIVPAWGGPDRRFPVVVALHGRGESLKPPEEGVMGWPRDYALTHAIQRVSSPPLGEGDFEGFVTPERLTAINEELNARPFQGLIIACPYLPDLRLSSDDAIEGYARFVLNDLLPRVRRETPALSDPESTGIDGVSFGGIIALRVGLGHPEAFGAVGSLQAAIRVDDASVWTDRARAAVTRRPELKLRVLTSHDDYYHEANTAMSAAWRAAGIAHEFADVPGPHDYPFNRGPGSIELLLWHDRALR